MKLPQFLVMYLKCASRICTYRKVTFIIQENRKKFEIAFNPALDNNYYPYI